MDFSSKTTINDEYHSEWYLLYFKITVIDAGNCSCSAFLEYSIHEVLALIYRQESQITSKQGERLADFSSGKITFV